MNFLKTKNLKAKVFKSQGLQVVTMLEVSIRFYEELNFFLPEEQRKKLLRLTCKEGTTVKALIESKGIPHTEVDLVLVNGESVGFDYQLKTDDRISVYPVFESFDIHATSKLRQTPLRETRFILDVHLGKLAKWLRMLGFDTLYSNTYADETVVHLALREKRIILTRDRQLLQRKIVTHGYYIKSLQPRTQLKEVIERFDLSQSLKPFSRCLICNTTILAVNKAAILDQLPPHVRVTYHEYGQCPHCQRIYWRGTHWENMQKLLKSYN